jgi:NitT/TauT family transport system permease protein
MNTARLMKVLRKLFGRSSLRGYAAIVVFTLLWELCVRLELPIIGNVPTPSSVLLAVGGYVSQPEYWQSWAASMFRVYGGFLAAQALGIPLGLYMAANRTGFDLAYPLFEILRPIPPLAWMPAAVIFWPTNDSSMMSLTFLGAFFPIVLNIVEGAKSMDKRYVRAALSLGSTPRDIFRHILFPACLPSIVTGMVVGMGAAWMVVIAAEMVASSALGLGQMTWRAFVVGQFPGIIIGMVSIGLAGYFSSSVIRFLSRYMTPWLYSR